MGKAFEAVNRCIESLVDQKDLDQVGGLSFQIHKFGHLEIVFNLCGIYSIFLEFLCTRMCKEKNPVMIWFINVYNTNIYL